MPCEMNDNIHFDNVITHLDKYETNIDNYLIQQSCASLQDSQSQQFLAYNEPYFEIKEPKVYIWEFMDQENLKSLMVLEKKQDVRNQIYLKVGKSHPKGKGRKLFVELMYNVTKYCKTSNFNLEKSGALLSQFYLTHLFFTSKLDMSADKVYNYFKDLIMAHTLPFPPDCEKLFSHMEAKEVMELFYRLYIRNVPLIRFLCLPNFAFHLNYELEPELHLKEKKEKKDKDKKKGKKASKSGSKKGSKK